MTHPRAGTIFQADFQRITLQTDRFFLWLLTGQWLSGILVALVWSPRTWIAEYWSVHQHVMAAALLGALFGAYPVYCILRRPGTTYTRHMIAVGQMLQSALLVHVTGGRIETHFHVFGSLALLAFYRDWRVLMTASAVVCFDHIALGAWFPLSVYGVERATIWRSVEHAWWVVFEVVFLTMACRRGIRELHAIADRQVRAEETTEQLARSNEETLKISQALQAANEALEHRVQERTKELQQAKEGLEETVGQRTHELRVAKEGLEAEVLRRTKELAEAKAALEDQVKQLEVLNHAMMGREERILELKDEIQKLKTQMPGAGLR